MRLSLNVLKQFFTNSSLDNIPAVRLANILVRRGLEVEGIEEYAKVFIGLVIGKVLQTSKHPNADRLNVCQVNIGTVVTEIVCGAQNVRAGLAVAVALPGTTIPNGVSIQTSDIRGVTSNGMICSYAELCLPFKGVNGGIAELHPDLIAGASFAEAVFNNDTIFDVAITPNRGDCASIIGIARELQAAGLGHVKLPNYIQLQDEGSPIQVDVDGIIASSMAISGANGLSMLPLDLWKNMLCMGIDVEAQGLYNSLAKYVLLTTGSFVAIFNGTTIGSNMLAITTLQRECALTVNGVERKFDIGCVALVSGTQVISILGLCTDDKYVPTNNTNNVIAMCTYIPAGLFIKYARQYSQAFATDEKYLIERTTDWNATKEGCAILCGLVQQIAGGSITASIDAALQNVEKTVTVIPYNVGEFTRITGASITSQEVKTLLEPLGFTFSGSNIVVPTYRSDITEDVDITEELMRQIDINTLPMQDLKFVGNGTGIGGDNKEYERGKAIKRTLASRGFKEVLNYLFVESNLIGLFANNSIDLTLQDPLNNLDEIQCNILPNLLKNLHYNLCNYKFNSLSLFELSNVFYDCTNHEAVVGGIRFAYSSNTNALTVKADVQSVLTRVFKLTQEEIDFGCVAINEKDTDEKDATGEVIYANPYATFNVVIGGAIVARFGEIHPSVLIEMGFDAKTQNKVCFFEIFIDRLLNSSIIANRLGLSYKANYDLEPQEVLLLTKSLGIGENELANKLSMLPEQNAKEFVKHAKNAFSQMRSSGSDDTLSAIYNATINSCNSTKSNKLGVQSCILWHKKDIAFILSEDIPAGEVVKTILESSEFIVSARSVGVFKGSSKEDFGAGNVSITFSFIIKKDELTKECVLSIMRSVAQNVASKHFGKLRGTLE